MKDDKISLDTDMARLIVLENSIRFALLKSEIRKLYLSATIKDYNDIQEIFKKDPKSKAKTRFGLGKTEIDRNKLELVSTEIDIETFKFYLDEINKLNKKNDQPEKS